MGLDTPESIAYRKGFEAGEKFAREHRHDIASHCPRPGHFQSTVTHGCEMCAKDMSEMVSAADELARLTNPLIEQDANDIHSARLRYLKIRRVGR